ncbi:PH domain-containing protein [Nocardia mexicana]|uniref:PH (Pleckstrin Homology) domain-containing protein n=1 Tax=Nocardia mexicana TaxID=279262 RepID=A0A370H5H6_9NOCA|nr:PH domain-containing protein [Nocardia mexicana]RDI50732.1 PH (Pleckstrin Homology) domain-containing protein [Nocardia mexicana]
MPVVRIWKRSPRPSARGSDGTERGGEGADWDLEVRPRRSVRTARIVAAVLAVLFTIAGIASSHSTTGVNFRGADQVAIVCFGWLLAGAVLLLTRPRVRVGPQGVSVRNIVGDNNFPWKDIRGVSIPDKRAWARLELVDDEYVPMLAIRVNDKEYAARSMDRFRELGAKYTAGQDK